MTSFEANPYNNALYYIRELSDSCFSRVHEENLKIKTMIVLPTYNERDNIAPLVEEIFKYRPDCEILVVDDNYPDKTWELVEITNHTDPREH